MRDSFHYLLMANQALMQKRLYSELKNTGFTPGQPKVLEFLKEHDGANQKDIASGCHIEAASLTSVMNRMEESGLIERRILNGNRRSCHSFLTDKGRALGEVVEQGFLHLEEIAFQGISKEEERQFIDTFLHIYENMAKRSEVGREEI